MTSVRSLTNSKVISKANTVSDGTSPSEGERPTCDLPRVYLLLKVHPAQQRRDETGRPFKPDHSDIRADFPGPMPGHVCLLDGFAEGEGRYSPCEA